MYSHSSQFEITVLYWWPLSYSDTALSSIDMYPTDIWMQDQCITKSPPTDKNRKGNSRHSSMPTWNSNSWCQLSGWTKQVSVQFI